MLRSFTSMCPLLNEASEHEYTKWIIYQAAVFSLRICVNKWVCISAWSSPLGESLVSMEKKAKHKSSDPRRGGEGGWRGWKIVVLGQAQTLGGKVKEYSAWFLALKPGFDLYCVYLGKLLNLHVPQFLYLWKSLVYVCSILLTLCDPIDWSLPGSSVHGIFQTGILEWDTNVCWHSWEWNK